MMDMTFENSRKVLVDALQTTHPYLMNATVHGRNRDTAAKNIGTLLAKDFPGVAFKITRSGKEEFECIWIEWKDGPRSHEVEALCVPFESGGIFEKRDVRLSAWQDAFGYTRRVILARKFSDDAVAAAIKKLTVEIGERFAAVKATPNRWRNRSLFNQLVEVPGLGFVDVQGLIASTLERS